MKKKLKNLLFCISSFPVASTLFTMSSCGFTPDQEIVQHDKESWKHAIEHIATCGHPTIYLTTNAAYLIQQAASLFLSASQLAIEKGCTYENPNYKYNDQIYLVPGSAWKYKTAEPGSSAGYFALNYDKLVSNEYGFVDILAESKKVGSKIDLSLGNHMLISNLQDFDISLSDYIEREDNIEFNGFDWQPEIINKIMDLYESVDQDIKFNFVTTDFSWNNIIDKHYNSEAYNKLQVRMFRKMDKFFLLSDGAYTWDTENANYADFFKKTGYISAKKQKSMWSKIVDAPIATAENFYKTISPWVFYNNETYFYHFCASDKATFADCYLDEKRRLTKETTYKFSSPWLVPDSYKVMFNNESTNFTNFKKSYLALFKYYEEGKQQKFSDCVSFDTYKNFSPSKKNLIFALPGAFRPDRCVEQVWVECRKAFEKIQSNYPINEWNYIYKFHPAMSETDVMRSLRKLFNIEEGVPLPENTVIINPVYPFEYLISLDQQLVKDGRETNYHLIDPNTLDDKKPSGIMTGFDLSSTLYFAAMSIMENEFGYKWDNCLKLVQNDAFFIPKNFGIPSYIYEAGHDYSQENIDNLVKFYLPLYQTGEFINPSSFEIFE